MTKDEQEALSRLYSDDVIRLLPLSSGAVAVFNNARDLCGIIQAQYHPNPGPVWKQTLELFYPPRKPPEVDLDDLGLT